MAIAKKPKSTKGRNTPSEEEVDKVIEKGGGVPDDGEGETDDADKRENKAFLVRVDPGLLETLDKAVEQNPVIRSRNTWVVNAIYEQLKRDGYV